MDEPSGSQMSGPAGKPEKMAKKRRNCGPKTKTGCQTCKIRRIKCDETKPSCNRCTSTGRKCDGYTTSPPPLNLSSSQTFSIVHRMSTRPPGTTSEKRGFQFFLSNTITELTSYYACPFWDHFVLQASSAEPSLRHAIIAIGALHEEFGNKRLNGDAPVVEGVGIGGLTETEFAINQYSKAISHLRKSLGTGSQAPLTALMTCILFVIFESLRGTFGASMLHLQSGIKILEDMRKRARHGEGGKDMEIVESKIVPLFTRLTIQAILYIDTREEQERKKLALGFKVLEDKRGPWEGEFKNLEEAREALNRACSQMLRNFHLISGFQPMSANPPEVIQMFEISYYQLSAWETLFERFMRAHSSTFTPRELRGAALLKIHHLTAQIMGRLPPLMKDDRLVAVAVNDPESFVECLPKFATILNLLKSLITAAEADRRNGKPSLTFSADLGVVGPLYYLATKCPVHSIREEALDLLSKCPRREGMWDTSITETVKQYWNLEEEHRKRTGGAGGTSGEEQERTLTEMFGLFLDEGGNYNWKWRDSRQVLEDDEGGWYREGSRESSSDIGSTDGLDEWFLLLGEQ